MIITYTGSTNRVKIQNLALSSLILTL